jgi:hypothetical protein
MILIETFLKELHDGTVIDNNFKWEFEYSQLPESFLNWFMKHGECFERQTNEKDYFDRFNVSKTTNSQCFQNSQLLALENLDVKYYEGLVYGTKFKMTFHHGFNIVDNKAIDVTDFYNNTISGDEDSNWSKEEEILYFGVHIPNEFINKYNERLVKSSIHNPIILDYYKTLSYET